MHVDRDGNVWVTDSGADSAVATAAKAGVKAGHIVRKFSPDGQVLMTLGEPGVGGDDEYHFRSPAGVVTAPNGDIFVADGHFTNNRIVKYSKDGKFIKAWGKTGYGPGEFQVPHCIAMDKRGRLFVCDRSNARIQIFDQDGKFLARWHQFGMPSGIAFSINDEDLIYVFDSESDNVENPGFEQGIRIGDALNGWVKYFILDQGGNPGSRTGSGPEFGTVDKFGNVFAGEPRPRVLRKYVKVR
jgi:NHL repeat